MPDYIYRLITPDLKIKIFASRYNYEVGYAGLLYRSTGGGWKILRYATELNYLEREMQTYAGRGCDMAIVETKQICPAHPEDIMNGESLREYVSSGVGPALELACSLCRQKAGLIP